MGNIMQVQFNKNGKVMQYTLNANMNEKEIDEIIADTIYKYGNPELDKIQTLDFELTLYRLVCAGLHLGQRNNQ